MKKRVLVGFLAAGGITAVLASPAQAASPPTTPGIGYRITPSYPNAVISASGTLTVPTISGCSANSAQWGTWMVGVGAARAGVAAECFTSDVPSYSVQAELPSPMPGYMSDLRLYGSVNVRPGDTVTARVSVAPSGNYTLAVKDVTSGLSQTWSDLPCPANQGSAPTPVDCTHNTADWTVGGQYSAPLVPAFMVPPFTDPHWRHLTARLVGGIARPAAFYQHSVITSARSSSVVGPLTVKGFVTNSGETP